MIRLFQSLTRDSNHSNPVKQLAANPRHRFNPSRGIAIIQTTALPRSPSFLSGFNPSRGIAIIQTRFVDHCAHIFSMFQSLTRDSNHSNLRQRAQVIRQEGFNPSRGIAIIQTRRQHRSSSLVNGVSIPHAG